MLAKIALRNLRRSSHDYGVYLITLMFGVAIFYAFNSIGSQSVLFDIQETTVNAALQMTEYLLNVFSLAVVLALAFLVVYANRFIIKRRKREFGTYLLLGMPTFKVALILCIEMITASLASLVFGLVMGVLLSQCLAFATAALMGSTMFNYQFLVSPEALLMTAACFMGLFAATLVMNVALVSGSKLSKLLAERPDMRSFTRIPLWLRVVAFVCSLGMIGLSYFLFDRNAFIAVDASLVSATILLVAGTVLLFWSASSTLFVLFKRADHLYHDGLHAFTARQVSAKVSSAFASMSVVSLMLFLAITTVSVSFGYMSQIVEKVEGNSQFDASVVASLAPNYVFAQEDASYESALALAKEHEPEALSRAQSHHFDVMSGITDGTPAFDGLVKDYVQVDHYSVPGLTYSDMLQAAGLLSEDTTDESLKFAATSPISFVPKSQFDHLLELAGKQPIKLGKNEFLVNNTLERTQGIATSLRTQHTPLVVAGHALTCADTPLAQPTCNDTMNGISLEIVVPDDVIATLRSQGAFPYGSDLNISYTCDRVLGDKMFYDALSQAFPYVPSPEDGPDKFGEVVASNAWPTAAVLTGLDVVTQAQSFRLLITYLALYIGFVLLVTTATILAIQQLSETTDSIARYRRLDSLGCERHMLLDSLRTQTLLYFLSPLVVALAHSILAIHVLNASILSWLGVDASHGAFAAGLLVLIVYGCYLLASYQASKHLVIEACRD